jgi:hypothetical protein
VGHLVGRVHPRPMLVLAVAAVVALFVADFHDLINRAR